MSKMRACPCEERWLSGMLQNEVINGESLNIEALFLLVMKQGWEERVKK
nr:hypothetical protein [Ectobacillus panaciterrae]